MAPSEKGNARPSHDRTPQRPAIGVHDKHALITQVAVCNVIAAHGSYCRWSEHPPNARVMWTLGRNPDAMQAESRVTR